MAAQQAWLTQGIYMGVSGAATIQQEIMKGLHADTSVAVIENATLHHQRQAVCILVELQSTIVRAQLASPSVIVVGDALQGLLAAGLHSGSTDDPITQQRTA
jgi:uroporphyrin-III C-methyltransferase